MGRRPGATVGWQEAVRCADDESWHGLWGLAHSPTSDSLVNP